MHREEEIIHWAILRNLLGPTGEATKHGQICKTFEEVTELLDAINKNDANAVRDAIGDIIVTLVIQASMWNIGIEESIDAAWEEIKYRKGRMVGGIFVKES